MAVAASEATPECQPKVVTCPAWARTQLKNTSDSATHAIRFTKDFISVTSRLLGLFRATEDGCGATIANTGLCPGYVERNYRRCGNQSRRAHVCVGRDHESEDHSKTYCVLNNWRPPGSVTRGASGPSRASNFLIGSSCKRKNLNPTSRGFPAASLAAKSLVERVIYASIGSSRTFGSDEWIMCTSPSGPWAIRPVWPTKALPPKMSFWGAPPF